MVEFVFVMKFHEFSIPSSYTLIDMFITCPFMIDDSSFTVDGYLCVSTCVYRSILHDIAVISVAITDGYIQRMRSIIAQRHIMLQPIDSMGPCDWIRFEKSTHQDVTKCDRTC
eukprot:336175_1